MTVTTVNWPGGLMDKASDFGPSKLMWSASEDCGFESHRGHYSFIKRLLIYHFD